MKQQYIKTQSGTQESTGYGETSYGIHNVNRLGRNILSPCSAVHLGSALDIGELYIIIIINGQTLSVVYSV